MGNMCTPVAEPGHPGADAVLSPAEPGRRRRRGTGTHLEQEERLVLRGTRVLGGPAVKLSEPSGVKSFTSCHRESRHLQKVTGGKNRAEAWDPACPGLWGAPAASLGCPTLKSHHKCFKGFFSFTLPAIRLTPQFHEPCCTSLPPANLRNSRLSARTEVQIGRASCRERV